jgi:hypothetical protein
MFYAKLNNKNKVERYPYTLTDLRFEAKNTSFPEQIDEATARSFGLVPVTPTPPPAQTFQTNLERTAIQQSSKWVEKWVETPATAEQITERTTACANDARQKRNQLLAACDWTQLPDAPVEKEGWAAYRSDLRNVTRQAGFPWEISWPEAPFA